MVSGFGFKNVKFLSQITDIFNTRTRDRLPAIPLKFIKYWSHDLDFYKVGTIGTIGTAETVGTKKTVKLRPNL